MTPLQTRARLLALLLLVAGLVAPAFGGGTAHAAGPPFTCAVPTGFLTQGGPTQLYTSNLGSGTVDYVAVGPPAGVVYNATAFDPADGYLYAVTNTAQDPHELLQIDATGTATDLGTIAGLPPQTNFVDGSFDGAGHYWLATTAFKTAYQVHLSPPAVVRSVPLSAGWRPSDFTFADGFMWGAGPNAVLSRMDLTTGQVDELPSPSGLPTGIFGAAWTYANGNLGLASNATGTIYEIAIGAPASATPTFTISATYTGPNQGQSNNDGTACVPPPTDLAIQVHGPTTAPPGGAVTWDLTVTDDGPGNSSGFSLDDPAPAGVTGFTSTTPGCVASASGVHCSEGALATGGSYHLAMSAQAPTTPAACATNTATIHGNEVDPTAANDTASATTCVASATTTTTTTTTTTAPATTTTTSPPTTTTTTSRPLTTTTTTARTTTARRSATTTTTIRAATTTTTTPPAPPTTVSPESGSSPSSPRGPPAPPHPKVVVRSIVGERSGPPGVGIDVHGSGWQGCAHVYVYFDNSRIGTGSVDPAGDVRLGSLSAPGGASPGPHTITASCRATPNPQGTRVQRTTFAIRGAAIHRTGFVTSLPQPRDVIHSLGGSVRSAAIAAGLILLLACPSQLFNSTLQENYEEVRGWFGLTRTRAELAQARYQRWLFPSFLVVGGILNAALAPDFGLNRSTAALALGLAAAIGFLVFASASPTALYRRVRYHEQGHVMVLPMSVVVALACVLVSRLLDFQPGYLYGLVAAFVYRRDVDDDTEGRLSASSAVLILGLAVTAWFVRVPVSGMTMRPGASFLALALEAFLGGAFLAGLEGAIVGLLPLRFLTGGKVKAWSFLAWTMLFGLAMTALVKILLQPGTGYVGHTSTAGRFTVLALYLAFLAGSLAFWAYFRYRAPRASHPG